MLNIYIPRLNKVQETKQHQDKRGHISTLGVKRNVLVEKIHE